MLEDKIKSCVIASLGFSPERTASSACINAIKKADIVVSFFAIDAHKAFVDSLGVKVYDISNYIEFGLGANTYSETLNIVIEQINKFNSIVYLTYGHPCVLDEVSERIFMYCVNNNINVEVIPSLSFIDEIIALRPIFIKGGGFCLIESLKYFSAKEYTNCPEVLILAQIKRSVDILGEKLVIEEIDSIIKSCKYDEAIIFDWNQIDANSYYIKYDGSKSLRMATYAATLVLSGW